MQEKLLIRLEQVENLGLAATSSGVVDRGKANGFKAASLSFIERVYGKDHSYYESFQSTRQKIKDL